MSIETKSYDNKNRGAFFLENDSEVLWSGNLEFLHVWSNQVL